MASRTRCHGNSGPGSSLRCTCFDGSSLADDYPSLRFIAGHEDLDTTTVPAEDDPTQQVYRKRDPGPLFPWQRILDAIPLKRLTP